MSFFFKNKKNAKMADINNTTNSVRKKTKGKKNYFLKQLFAFMFFLGMFVERFLLRSIKFLAILAGRSIYRICLNLGEFVFRAARLSTEIFLYFTKVIRALIAKQDLKEIVSPFEGKKYSFFGYLLAGYKGVKLFVKKYVLSPIIALAAGIPLKDVKFDRLIEFGGEYFRSFLSRFFTYVAPVLSCLLLISVVSAYNSFTLGVLVTFSDGTVCKLEIGRASCRERV